MKETTKAAETVRVVAPATLREGYTFDVVVEGETQRVEAAREGEEFDAIVVDVTPPAFNPEVVAVPVIPDEAGAASQFASASTTTNKHNPDGTTTITEETRYHDGHAGIPPEAAISQTASSPPTATADAPTGAWRHGIFSCFETCDSSLFWMGWCCTYIAIWDNCCKD